MEKIYQNYPTELMWPIRGEASRFQNKKNPGGRKKVEKDLEARKK